MVHAFGRPPKEVRNSTLGIEHSSRSGWTCTTTNQQLNVLRGDSKVGLVLQVALSAAPPSPPTLIQHQSCLRTELGMNVTLLAGWPNLCTALQGSLGSRPIRADCRRSTDYQTSTSVQQSTPFTKHLLQNPGSRHNQVLLEGQRRERSSPAPGSS